MKVYDFVYGEFDIPAIVDPLVFAPEFQRLSNVRLLNTNSPSLSSLSEITRYSHTIGVLRLALLNESSMMSSSEFVAFLAAVILHDVGTPAYAHLLEYQLSDRFGWNHESTAYAITKGTHHSDGENTQIFQNLPVSFEKLCSKNGIDFGLVQSIIAKEHPSHRLLFGTIDLDNLDNVVRMARAIGKSFDLSMFTSLAENIGYSNSGDTLLAKRMEKSVRHWSEIRSLVYNVLVYDPHTVSRQAVLSSCIRRALDSGDLDQSDWIYNDSELVYALEQTGPSMKARIHRDFKSEPPQLCLICKIDQEIERFRVVFTPESIVSYIEAYLEDRMKRKSCYGYMFVDKGTFEKRLDFMDPEDGLSWSVGNTTNSIVLYGFSRRNSTRRIEPLKMGQEFLQTLNEHLRVHVSA